MKQSKHRKTFKIFLRKISTKIRRKIIEGSSYVFDSVDLLTYNLHNINLNRGGSFIDLPKWIKNKKGTINPKK